MCIFKRVRGLGIMVLARLMIRCGHQLSIGKFLPEITIGALPELTIIAQELSKEVK
jgi:hypothetical protein